MDTLRADKPYDDNLRRLVHAIPEAFISWLLGKAQLIERLPEKLQTWKLEVDALLRVVFDGKEMLLHIEFQAYNDSSMPERLLRYNVLARSEYNLPVLSCVIYLLRDGNVQPSPLRWTVPTGQDILEFHFGSIELGEMSPEELLVIDQPGLLVLLPLTKGGANREVTEKMFTGLEASGQTELVAIGGTLASLIFSKEHSPDLGWLHRRLHEMHDILRESPYYQEILQEGRQEGLEEGLQEGLQKGELKGLREMLLTLVQTRFPKLTRIAKGLATITDDSSTLQHLILKMSLAQSFEEAQKYLLEEGEENGN